MIDQRLGNWQENRSLAGEYQSSSAISDHSVVPAPIGHFRSHPSRLPSVIPAKAGIQRMSELRGFLDTGLRRWDENAGS